MREGLRIGRYLLIASGAIWLVNYMLTQGTLAMFMCVGSLAGAGLCTVLEDSIR